MTQIIATVPSDVIQAVFAKISLTESFSSLPGGKLYKDAAGPIMAAVREIWERRRELLSYSARNGWDAAQSGLDEINTKVDELVEKLEEQAEAFQELLLAKLRELMRETVDFVLRSVRCRIDLGGFSYVLNSIELETKLVYSTSIEGLLTVLCKFVGNGELKLVGTYALLKSDINS